MHKLKAEVEKTTDVYVRGFAQSIDINESDMQIFHIFCYGQGYGSQRDKTTVKFLKRVGYGSRFTTFKSKKVIKCHLNWAVKHW